tara:strand:- start:2977 stop:4578 length:1602 start_codon:yes stop_codon:yes gene_type:complete
LKFQRTTRDIVSLPLCFTILLAFNGCAKTQVKTEPTIPNLQALELLQNDINAYLNHQDHQRGTWGIAVQSMTNNQQLYAWNPTALLVPASTMKLVTLAVASATVGWDYRFETTLQTTGPISQGVLKGDLLFTGSGNPALFGRAGGNYSDDLIATLQQRGINSVDGRIIGNDNLVEEPRPGLAWSWEDLAYPYGTLTGGLNWAENVFQILVSPGQTESASTSIEQLSNTPAISVENNSVTSAPNTDTLLWPEWQLGSTGPTVMGTIAANSDPVMLKISVGNPTLWFARAIKSMLIANGITVSGSAIDADDLAELPQPKQTLHIHQSSPLSKLAEPLLKDSINLYGEAFLRLATGPLGTRTTSKAIEAAYAQLAQWGIKPDSIRIADGSGLSRQNLLSAESLLTLLRVQYRVDPSPFLQALPIAGIDGTLKQRLKSTPAEGNAKAKTGSMANIQSLAGYVTSRDAEPLAFVIIANNFEGPATSVLTTIDQIVARLALFSRSDTRSNFPLCECTTCRSFLGEYSVSICEQRLRESQ